MQHKRLQWLYTKIVSDSKTEGKDTLNRCDFRCVLKIDNVRDRPLGADLEDCSKHVPSMVLACSATLSFPRFNCIVHDVIKLNLTDALFVVCSASSIRTTSVWC